LNILHLHLPTLHRYSEFSTSITIGIFEEYFNTRLFASRGKSPKFNVYVSNLVGMQQIIFFIVLNISSLDSIVDIIKKLISLREEIDREHDLSVYHRLHRI